jgi:acetylornithine deacetylase/succinyl-diaminopimelate desuccinylase-like protein
VRRLSDFQPEAQIHETWRRFIEGMGFPREMAEPLLDPARITEFCRSLPVGLARQAHACTHTTFAPTVAHGGSKTNVIPDRVRLEVDIRTLPGQTSDEVRGLLDDALGDLADKVDLRLMADDPSSASPVETPLWDALARVSGQLHPGSGLIPFLTVGATDARFFRRLGIPSYGFGLFSERLSFEQFATMFHGDDERVDQGSLRLSTEMWEALARDFLA